MIEKINELKTRNLSKLTREIFNYYSHEIIGKQDMILSSVVKHKNKIVIDKNNFRNFYNQIPKNVYIKESEKSKFNWCCNIQQIKYKDINNLYFALYFSDKISFYKISRNELYKMDIVGKHQHRDNSNEWQFMIKNTNINLFDKYLMFSVEYRECFM